MLKHPTLIALVTLLGTASAASTYAQDEVYLPQPPDMPAYMAYKVKLSQREKVKNAVSVKGLKGVYFSGIIGGANMNVNDIKRTGATDPNALPSVPTITSIRKTMPFFGANIGYAIPFLLVPSRIEVEYLYYQSLNYNPSPAITNFNPPPNINSTFQTQTVMGNLYYDFDFDSQFVPYVGAGAGAAFNNTNGTVVDNVNPNITFDKTNTSFAWNARAGLRIKVTPSFILDGGYQFVWFGKARWPLPTIPFLGNQQLQTDDIYANSLMFKLTWQFA